MKHTAFFALIFCAAGLWAQTPAEEIFSHPLGPQNTDAFNLTCSNLAAHKLARGKFEQEKKINKLNRSLKSSGNFLIAAELGMVWDTVKPFPSTLVLGSDYLIQSRPGGQRTVLNAKGNEIFTGMAEVMSAVFSGNSRGLLENFDVYYSGGASAWELGLSPRNGAISSFAQKIIMKGGADIKSILIYEQNGDTVQYFLSNHSYPSELNSYEKKLFSIP